MRIAVLLSVGSHPGSGRARRADRDARALEIALRLASTSSEEERHVQAVHIGTPNEPALRDYLGMGLLEITVVDLPKTADVLPALSEQLAEMRPSLILAGTAAERGECSGFLPYALSESLGVVLVPGLVEIAIQNGHAKMIQALPRGQRRRLEASLPLIATVDLAAPRPRFAAFARARRGRVISVLPQNTQRLDNFQAEEQPARIRPRKLLAPPDGSAQERLRAIGESRRGQGRVLFGPSATEAAEAIHKYLMKEGILRRSE